MKRLKLGKPNPFEEIVDVKYLALRHIEKTIGVNPKDERWDEIAITFKNMFIAGYKAAQSKGQYSLDDMETLMEEALNWFGGGRDKDISDSKEFFEKYIQSLSTQQLPKEFIPEYYTNGDMIVKNRERIRELVGTYKY